MQFDLHIGIDYSGRATSTSRTGALQVYAGTGLGEPSRVCPPSADDGTRRNWNRQEIAEWLIAKARQGIRYVAGIDHAFSFPLDYFHRYELTTWHEFLDDFCQHWPTDRKGVSVEHIRQATGGGLPRTGQRDELRLTERWTSSAKSVFQFDVQGSVAKSTHAGLPWLAHIREQVGDRIHIWPFDGWDVPPDRCVIAEVYPSLFSKRSPRADRTPDEQDAFSVADWLSRCDQHAILGRYLNPPLQPEERQQADLEGWILGVS